MSFRIDLWLQARERYLDGINDEQKALFQSATLENLFHIYNIGTVESQSRERSRSNSAAKKLQSLVTAIDYFGSIIDAPPSAISLILRTIWGSIRALLYLSSNFRKYYSKLINALKTLGDIIFRLNAYERLFPTHKHIIEYIPLVYLDVFDFCLQANNLFRNARTHQCAIQDLWKSFMEGSAGSLRKIRHHMERVEVEASLACIIKEAADKEAHRREIQQEGRVHGLIDNDKKPSLSSRIRGLEHFREQKEWERHLIMLEQESNRISALQKLSRYQSEWRHHKLQRERNTGTGKWITLTNEFCSWINQDSSSFIWLYGIAGSGKTILTSAVIDTIKSKYSLDGALLAYFYCDYENNETLQPREIIGNIIQQLSNDPRISKKICQRVQDIYKNDYVPSIRELSDLLSVLIEEIPKIYIILDGLDECKEKERELILPWLVMLGRSTTSIVKLFVSSRVEGDIQKSFTGHNLLSVAASPENVSSDIAKVVEYTIKTKIRDEKFCVRDPILLREIIDTLVEKGHGRFLWVRFQLDDICGEMSEDGVRSVLKNLPSDLNETYKRALVEIIHQGAIQVNLAQKAFRWIVAARRTLTLDELREVVAIEAKDKSVDLYKVPDASQIIRACGKLVVYGHQDRSLHLAHYTVQQFLVSDVSPDEIEISGQLTNFHFRPEIAEIEAANICVTYLMFNDFEAKFERETTLAVTQSNISNLTTTGWMPDMPGLIKKTKSDMLIFLRKAGFSRPSVESSQRFNLLLRPCRATRIKYRLLNYVINYWAEHTIFLEGSCGMIELFVELVLDRKNCFHFRPWGDGEIGISNRLCENLFRWAVKNDYGHIIATLLASSTERTGYRPFDTSPVATPSHLASSYIYCLVEGEFPFHYAAKMGYERTLQVFVSDHGQRLFSSFYSTPTIIKAINMALSNGHEGAAMILLETFAKTPEFKLRYAQNHYPPHFDSTPKLSFPSDKNAYLPLHRAAQFRLKKVVGILFSSFGYRDYLAINSPDATGFHPIHYCCQNGDLGMLELLFKTRSLHVCYATNDDKGSRPLYLALYNGYEDVVEFLLGVGAYIDEETYTLALKATCPGHIQVLNALSPTLEASIRSEYRPNVRNFLISHGNTLARRPERHNVLRSLPIRAIVTSSKVNSTEVLEELLLWASEFGQSDILIEIFVGAAGGGAGGLVKRLLGMGIEVDARNSFNRRALSLAVKNGHDHVVKLLMEAGAINTRKKIRGRGQK